VRGDQVAEPINYHSAVICSTLLKKRAQKHSGARSQNPAQPPTAKAVCLIENETMPIWRSFIREEGVAFGLFLKKEDGLIRPSFFAEQFKKWQISPEFKAGGGFEAEEYCKYFEDSNSPPNTEIG